MSIIKFKSYYKDKSKLKSVNFLNSATLELISANDKSSILSGPNFSTQNEAIAEPTTTALFMFSKEISSVLAKYPINPPAKVSPAPVGSNTSSNGNAGV